MAVITKGTTFANGDQVTAAKLNNLADDATFASDAVDNVSTQLSGGGIIVKDGGVSTAKLADTAVTTAKIADSNVTKAKIENVADMKVLGNTSGSAAAPQEVSVLDEDDMTSDSATAIATQQSIKAYVDSATNFTPSTYAGGESVTLPNGLIMKFGSITSGIPNFGVQGSITFASAFPTSCLYANIITNDYNNGSYNNNAMDGVSTTAILYKHGMNPAPTVIYWQAIGY